MKAKSPFGGEPLDVSYATGKLYSKDCLRCGTHVGGCIVGGNSPYQSPPKQGPCPFCGGEVAVTEAE